MSYPAAESLNKNKKIVRTFSSKSSNLYEMLYITAATEMMDLCCMHLLSFMTLSALNITPAINYILCDVHMSIHTHTHRQAQKIVFFLFWFLSFCLYHLYLYPPPTHLLGLVALHNNNNNNSKIHICQKRGLIKQICLAQQSNRIFIPHAKLPDWKG